MNWFNDTASSTIHRLILCEKKRLENQRRQYGSKYENENHLDGDDDINEENSDLDGTESININGNDEDVADDEDGFSTTLSEDISEEPLTNLMESFDDLELSDNRCKYEYEKGRNGKEHSECGTETHYAVKSLGVKTDPYMKHEIASEGEHFNEISGVHPVNTDDDKYSLEKKPNLKEISFNINSWTNSGFSPEPLDKSKDNESILELRNTQVMLLPHEASVDSGTESLDSLRKTYNDVIKQLKLSSVGTKTETVPQNMNKSASFEHKRESVSKLKGSENPDEKKEKKLSSKTHDHTNFEVQHMKCVF